MVRKHIIQKEPSLTLKNEEGEINEIKCSHLLSEQSSLNRKEPLFFPFSFLFLNAYPRHTGRTFRDLREKQ